MKKYSVATHTDDNGETLGVTIIGTGISVDDEGLLRVYDTNGINAAIFAADAWLHVFDVDASA